MQSCSVPGTHLTHGPDINLSDSEIISNIFYSAIQFTNCSTWATTSPICRSETRHECTSSSISRECGSEIESELHHYHHLIKCSGAEKNETLQKINTNSWAVDYRYHPHIPCSMHLMNACRANYGTEAKLREVQERNRQLLYMNVPPQIGESMLYLGKEFEPRKKF